MRDFLTPLILTFNERENIGRTLASLSWAREIVLIDSFSTDGTIEAAHAAHSNIRVVQRAFDTHTAQWNFGLDQITTAWVLTLDADYELSLALAEEIQRLQPPKEARAYSAPFEFRVHGHSLRASVYPPRVVLFRRDQARYHKDGHTQLLRTESDVIQLGGVIYHDDRKPLSRWLSSQDRYTMIEAKHLLATPLAQLPRQDRLRRRIYFAAPVMFLYLLFVRGLVLDGWPGWYYVLQRTLAEMLLSLRLLTEKEKLESAGDTVL